MRICVVLLVGLLVVVVVVLLRFVNEQATSSSGSSASRPSSPPPQPVEEPTNPGPRDRAGADLAHVGVPEDVHLTPTGSLLITRPGSVVQGRDVSGEITVAADDVTIRNTRVTGDGWTLITIRPGVTGTVIRHVELDGRGSRGAPGSTGVHGEAVVVGADIHSVENGIIPASGSVVRNCHIHALAASGPDPHYDGVQIDGGQHDVLIKHNTIDLAGQDQTSAVMINNDFGPVSDVVVRSNHLRGGAYTVYADGKFSDGPVTGVSFLDNRLGTGGYGYHLIRRSSVTWSGNVDDQGGGELRGP